MRALTTMRLERLAGVLLLSAVLDLGTLSAAPWATPGLDSRPPGPPAPASLWASGPGSVARLNALSRFFAGMDDGGQDDLCRLTQRKDWREFSERENRRWDRFAKFEARMAAWADDELRPRRSETGVVFYPFAGPDILHAEIFMPGENLYIMIGLEDVGFAQDAATIPGEKLRNLLAEYGDAVDDVVGLGFFRRTTLAATTSRSHLKGVLPIFCVLLARMGKEIVSVETGDVTANGQFAPAGDGPKAPAPRVLRLSYRDPGEEHQRTIVYFSQDLSDDPLLKNAGLDAYLEENLPHCFTYIKSASYLMHSRTFSEVRTMILAQSDAVLQDDSGVPFRLFDPNVWTLNLYGSYVAPIPTFKDFYQVRLCEAFQKGCKPLAFLYGYGRRPNLLWAVKKTL